MPQQHAGAYKHFVQGQSNEISEVMALVSIWAGAPAKTISVIAISMGDNSKKSLALKISYYSNGHLKHIPGAFAGIFVKE